MQVAVFLFYGTKAGYYCRLAPLQQTCLAHRDTVIVGHEACVERQEREKIVHMLTQPAQLNRSFDDKLLVHGAAALLLCTSSGYTLSMARLLETIVGLDDHAPISFVLKTVFRGSCVAAPVDCCRCRATASSRCSSQ